jgi:hypothetical protein
MSDPAGFRGGGWPSTPAADDPTGLILGWVESVRTRRPPLHVPHPNTHDSAGLIPGWVESGWRVCGLGRLAPRAGADSAGSMLFPLDRSAEIQNNFSIWAGASLPSPHGPASVQNDLGDSCRAHTGHHYTLPTPTRTRFCRINPVVGGEWVHQVSISNPGSWKVTQTIFRLHSHSILDAKARIPSRIHIRIPPSQST